MSELALENDENTGNTCDRNRPAERVRCKAMLFKVDGVWKRENLRGNELSNNWVALAIIKLCVVAWRKIEFRVSSSSELLKSLQDILIVLKSLKLKRSWRRSILLIEDTPLNIWKDKSFLMQIVHFQKLLVYCIKLWKTFPMNSPWNCQHRNSLIQCTLLLPWK